MLAQAAQHARDRLLRCACLYLLAQGLVFGLQWLLSGRLGLNMAGGHLLLAASACAFVMVLRRKIGPGASLERT